MNSQCFQSMFRIFSSKVQISRIPGKAVLCLQTNLGNGSLLQSDSLSVGKNRWDRIGWRRNQGLPARHSPDGAAVHFRGLQSTNRGSRELERLEGSLSSGRGILSSKLP